MSAVGPTVCEKTGEKHVWVRDPVLQFDVCRDCSVRWVDVVCGFHSNTKPKRLGKSPRSARP